VKLPKRVILLGPMFQSAQDLKLLKRILQDLKIRNPALVKRGSPALALDRLVGVDSGTLTWLKLGFHPDLAVGDWDSVNTRQRRRVMSSLSHLVLSPDKDRSDFYHALQAALQWVPEEIIAIGFTGGRSDHHLAALLDMAAIAEESARIDGGISLKVFKSLGPEAEYHFLAGGVKHWTGKLKKGTMVSVFSLAPVTQGVVLEGFRYLLQNEDLTPSSYGLSNVVESVKQKVQIRRGRLLIIVQSG